MSSNLFVSLKRLLPDSPVWIGEVVAHNAADDTSTIRLPTDQGDIPYAGALQGGSLIRARGRTVPIGMNAFVRDGLVENQAPSGTPVTFVVAPVTIVPDVQLGPTGAVPDQSLGVGSAYTLNLNTYVTGGSTPYAWSVVGGSLPAGLSLNSATGVITGTPTTLGGPTDVTFRVSDAQLSTADLPVEFTVSASAGLSLVGTVPNPITAYVGRQSAANLLPLGSQVSAVDLTAYITGGTAPITWSVVGAVPNLWSVTSTVSVSYSGTLPSTGSVTARATDASSAHVDLPLNLAVASLLVSTDAGNVGVPITVGVPLSVDLSTRHTGGVGTVSYSLVSGTMPAGLSLNTTTGLLSGTPTDINDFPVSLTTRSTDSQGQSFLGIFELAAAGANSWSGFNQNPGSGSLTLSNSDKTATFTGAIAGDVLAVLSSSDITGKKYCEFELVSRVDDWFHFFGLVETSAAPNPNASGNYAMFGRVPPPSSNFGGIVEGAGFTGFNDTFGFTVGDRIGVAYDATARELFVRKNGTWLGSAPGGTSPFATLATGTYRFAYTALTSSATSPSSVVRIYSGASEQSGSLPSGYTRY